LQTLSFAGELLKHAQDLIHDGFHPAEIVMGYKRAYEKCQELLAASVVYQVSDLRDQEQLAYILKPVLATKHNGYESFLASLVAEACLATMPVAPRKPRITADNVRVAKLQGGSVTDSLVVKGMVLQRDAEGTLKRVENAKITVFGCGLEASATEAKATILIRNADELRNYNKVRTSARRDGFIMSLAFIQRSCCYRAKRERWRKSSKELRILGQM
jgi:T-complex protein 1 subunit theta